MPRRKPTSTKQKKAEQQLKRAIKRGDAPAPEPAKKPPRKKKGRIGNSTFNGNAADIEKVKRLQSAFVKVSPEFLEETRRLASSITLQRPIPLKKTMLHLADSAQQVEATRGAWSCPRRPKWRAEMSKIEVEKNEEGWFKKWLLESDERVNEWVKNLEERRKADGKEETSMPASITHHERNLEVWRQLWRTTERAQILLVLIDSRCPTLHYPPSLASYLDHIKKKVILVLTKADISGSERVAAWKCFLHQRYPSIQIVQVESYAEKDITAVHQGKKQYEPSIPYAFRRCLIEAIKQAHNELLAPPERIQGDPERLRNWVPPVKQSVNWDALLEAQGDLVGLHVKANDNLEANDKDESDNESESASDKRVLEYLTIGLIGQPNVGKSSLLNALFGAKRVRASKTPGKTKHLQTLFWTPEVLLVDCPGLVMPNYVPTELQVLSGVLPISRVSAVMACVHFAAQVLPLEEIFGLNHPSLCEPAPADKRTWREGTRPLEEPKATTWTAADILTAYANANGWVTAKAGRPDVHRAGNAVLRALAEGRVQWAFWPEGHTALNDPSDNTLGIWIPRSGGVEAEQESEEEADHNEGEPGTDRDSDSGSEEEEDEDEESEEEQLGSMPSRTGLVSSGAVGRFGALALEDDEEGDSSASDA